MNEDKILQHIVEIKEDISEIKENQKNFVTRDEFNTRMDKMMGILERLDQERVFTTEWIRRIENDVDRIKQQLHIV